MTESWFHERHPRLCEGTLRQSGIWGGEDLPPVAASPGNPEQVELLTNIASAQRIRRVCDHGVDTRRRDGILATIATNAVDTPSPSVVLEGGQARATRTLMGVVGCAGQSEGPGACDLVLARVAVANEVGQRLVRESQRPRGLAGRNSSCRSCPGARRCCGPAGRPRNGRGSARAQVGQLAR